MKDKKICSHFPGSALQAIITCGENNCPERKFAENLFKSAEKEKYIPLFLTCLENDPTSKTMGRITAHYENQFRQHKEELTSEIKMRSERIFQIFNSFIQKSHKKKGIPEEALSAKEGIRTSLSLIEGNTSTIDQSTIDAYRKLNIGINDKGIEQILSFIQDRMPKEISEGKFYFNRHTYNLPCSVEHDPETKKIFIHLKEHTIKKIGSGNSKRITHSIEHDVKAPFLIANLMLKDRASESEKQQERKKRFANECEFLKKLTQLQCKYLPRAIAVTSHVKEKTGELKLQILQKIYSNGTLTSLIKNQKLSDEIKVQLATTLLQALTELHALGYAHRALHHGNILVDDQYKATIIDFGNIEEMAKLKGIKAQSRKQYLSPEAIFPEKMNGQNYEKTDLFACGIALYNLIYNKEPLWIEKKKLYSKFSDDMDECTQQKAIQKFGRAILEETQDARSKIEKNRAERKLSQIELVEYITLQLLHPDPKVRKTAADWVSLLQTNNQSSRDLKALGADVQSALLF